jgi:hypothetical protein
MQLHPSVPPYPLRARHLHSYISVASRTEPTAPTCPTNVTQQRILYRRAIPAPPVLAQYVPSEQAIRVKAANTIHPHVLLASIFFPVLPLLLKPLLQYASIRLRSPFSTAS